MPKPPLPKLLALLGLAIFAAGCGPAADRPATATAQAGRAIALATRMAHGLEATRSAQQVYAAATAQAQNDRFSEARGWKLQLSDPFDDERLAWPTGQETDPLADIAWSLQAGRYHWEATAHDSFVWWAIPEMESLGDFYLAATVRQLAGPAESEMGLVFRLDSENSRYYLFEINNAGQFALFLRDADWETLLDWQAAPAVLPGADNRLAVIAQGQDFLLAVNDQLVAGWQDERLPSGQAGVLIGLPAAGEQGTWTFDDFELRTPE